ncbi:MAG: hypothetical protein U0168_03860 [Nannocystaceae bacterium]
MAECAADVPEELGCAVEVGPFTLGACASSLPELPATSTIAVSRTAGVLHVELQTVAFRDDNEVCGYVVESEGVLTLLLQPCVLIPEGGVSSGDCWYESISVDIDEIDVASVTEVHVLHRVDRPVEFEPYTPEEIAVAEL